MAEAQLSVELTASIEGFRSGFNEATRIANAAGTTINKSVGGVADSFKSLSDPIATARNGFSTFADLGTSSTNRLRGALEDFREAAARATDPATLVHFNRQIELTKDEISRLSRVGTAGFNELGEAIPNAQIQSFSGRAMTARTSMATLRSASHGLTGGVDGLSNAFPVLLHHFQTLTAETGGTKAAFTTLGSTLLGPAGILIAVSALAPVIVSATRSIFNLGDSEEKTAKATAAMTKAHDDFLNKLDDVSKAKLNGSKDSLGEIEELKTLYNITQNAAFSIKQRSAAVDELQKKYPEYFKNIKDENFLNGEAKSAYDSLSNSILATARARAAQELVTKNSSRTLENDAKVKDLQVKIDKERLELAQRLSKAEIQQRSGMAAGSAGVGAAQGMGVAAIRAAGEERINKLITEQNKYKTDTTILNGRNLDLEKNITEQIQKGADLIGNVGDIPATKKAKEVRTLADVMKELNIELLQAANNGSGTFGEQQKEKVNDYQKAIDELIKLGYKPAGAAIQKLKEQQQGLFDKDAMGDDLLGKATPLNLEKLIPSTDPIIIKPELKLQPVITGLTEAEKSMQKLGEDFAKLTQSSISGAISGAANSIGEALASGNNVIEALGKSLLQSFGGFLSELGRLLVAYGTAALVKAQLDASLAIPGAAIITGPAAIAAGIALSIAGSAIGAFASGKGQNNKQGNSYQQPTAFANGGIIYGPTLGLMGEYAGAKSDPEVVAPLSKLKAIMGDAGQSTNVTNFNNDNEPQFIQRLEISGEKLLVITERAKKRLNRVS